MCLAFDLSVLFLLEDNAPAGWVGRDLIGALDCTVSVLSAVPTGLCLQPIRAERQVQV